jgi:hypothetical protein
MRQDCVNTWQTYRLLEEQTTYWYVLETPLIPGVHKFSTNLGNHLKILGPRVGDMTIPYHGLTNITRRRTKFSRMGNLGAPEFFQPCLFTVSAR